MTQGRFETSFNLRPKGWDNRKFWASGTDGYRDDPPPGFQKSATGRTHARTARSCDHDHRLRESCPFHDLRGTGGLFQPEEDLGGPHANPIEPDRLTARPTGQALRMNGVGEKSNSRRGVGGGLLPCDTDIAAGTGPARGGGPWTKSARAGTLSNGLFSTFEHMPGDFTLRPANVFGSEKGGLVAAFRSGTKSVGAIGGHPAHLPDIYPAGARQAAHWRLRTGKAPDAYRFPHAPEGGAPGGDEAGKGRRREIAARMRDRPMPFSGDKSVGGTFSKFPPHLPDPVPLKQIREYRPPIFTYHTHVKRNNPVIVPWTTGPQTADPDIVDGGVRSLELSKQNTSRVAVKSLPR